MIRQTARPLAIRIAFVERAVTYIQLFSLVLLIWEFCTEERHVLSPMSAYVLGTPVPSGDTVQRFLMGHQTFYNRYATTGFDPNDPPSSWRRLESAAAEVSEGKLNSRTVLWQAGLDMFRDRPFGGIGAGARITRSFRLTRLAVWSLGVCSLTWEYRKPTWLVFGLLAAHLASIKNVVAARVALPAEDKSYFIAAEAYS
jgi:hypothetical protein